MKVKVFSKTECDLHHKIGVWAYCLYDYQGELTGAKPFKKSIKTMTQADCMAVVNALYVLSETDLAVDIDELELVTDSSKVVKLIQECIGEKHCEEIAKYWKDVIKPKFRALKVITIVKTDRKGTGPADNINVLNRLNERAKKELNRCKQLTT